jgi:hypothetical protein
MFVIKQTNVGNALYNYLDRIPQDIVLQAGACPMGGEIATQTDLDEKGQYKFYGATIYLDMATGGNAYTMEELLGRLVHEFGHAFDVSLDPDWYFGDGQKKKDRYGNPFVEVSAEAYRLQFKKEKEGKQKSGKDDKAQQSNSNEQSTSFWEAFKEAWNRAWGF